MKFSRPITLLLLSFICTVFIGHSQTSYMDFVEQKDVRLKAEMGLDLWNEYLRFDLDSVKVVGVELLMTASETEDEFARAMGTRILGSYLFRSGKIDQGLDYMMASKEYFERKEDFSTSSQLYNEVGLALYLKGEYLEAIRAFQKSLELGKSSPDPTDEYNAKLGLGRSFIAKGDTSLGVRNIHDYKRLALQQSKFEAAADALAYLGMIESELGNSKESEEYYLRSLTNSKKSLSKLHLANSYTNMAILKYMAEDFDSSLFYFERSLQLRKSINNYKGIIEGYYNLGDYYSGLDESVKAIEFYSLSRKLAVKKNFIHDEIDAVKALTEMYKIVGDSALCESLTSELTKLEQDLEKKEGVDMDIIQSIELNIFKKEKKEEKLVENDKPNSWFIIALGILVIGLFAVVLAERRRFN